MNRHEKYINHIFTGLTEAGFNQMALQAFHHQYNHNDVYHRFVSHLPISIDSVDHYLDIPCLPIELFKQHRVVTGEESVTHVFESSGTTGQHTSRHCITDMGLYEKSFLTAFEYFYGDPSSFCFLAVLPSYVERGHSSLVYMVNHLIGQSKYHESGFYQNTDELAVVIDQMRRMAHRTIIIGVTYALLDLAEQQPTNLDGFIVMETGGMKGRRKEMVRAELHDILNKSFNTGQIHSEYGMTELLSQAYSRGDGLFECPPWMKICVRDINDPLTLLKPGMSGGVNVIDLANVNSCCFIATQDIGTVHVNNTFEISGRFDNSDTRGCNLLMQ